MIGKVIHRRWHIDAEPIIQLAYRRHPLAYRRHPLAYRRQRFSGSPVALGLQRSFKPLNLIFNPIFNPTLFASLKIAAYPPPILGVAPAFGRPCGRIHAASDRANRYSYDSSKQSQKSQSSVAQGHTTSAEQRQEPEMPGLRPDDSSPDLGPTILAKSNDGAGIQHKKRVIRKSRSSGLEDHRPPEPPWGPRPALVLDGI